MATPRLRPSLALSALLLGLLAACSPAKETTDLVIEVRHSAEENWESYTLTCDPTGGSHPTPDAACRTLVDIQPEDLAPTPPDQVCTMIYGGPQEAKVHGLLHGREVKESFTRENGCEIHRWDILGPDVLPVDLDWQN